MSASPKDVSEARRRELELDLDETSNLAEALAIDFGRLLGAAFPDCPSDMIRRMDAARGEGVTRRMQLAGRLIHEHRRKEALDACATSTSDTVRSWGAYALAERTRLALATLLGAIRPLADDSHFAVREWAWIAIRSRLIAETTEAVVLLVPWTQEPSERLRRFAVEAMRPRGVWCAHLPRFKTHPAEALPLLEPLRNDPARYVQDSVANWLNDASKSRAEWVRELIDRWVQESQTPETTRIAKRALRTLRKREQGG